MNKIQNGLGCLLGLTIGMLASRAQDSTSTSTMSPYGIGADHHTSQAPEKWIPQMAAIGIKVARSAHANWYFVEPHPGNWTWTQFDQQMDVMAKNGIESGALLYGDTPGVPLPGAQLPMDSLPGWTNYVSGVVAHGKGKIKYYEIWNEPPNGTAPDQTPADYANLMIASYNAAKAADPDCKIGLAAQSVNLNYLQRVIKAGAKGHYDWITLHPYEVLGTVVRDSSADSIYMHIVPTVRKMLADVDPDKVNVPIIFTEIGFDAGPPGDAGSMSRTQQATAVIKAYTMGIAEGVACVQWFEGMDGDSGPMGLLDGNEKPRPAYNALGQLIKHLGPKPDYLGWVLLNDKNNGFVFKGPQGNVLITWSSQKSPDPIDFGETVSIVDPATGTLTKATTYSLTTSPIIVEDAPAKLVEHARANKSKPFPWGGDYTDAKSVSITFGTNTTAKGLHTASGDDVAADVITYGGSARSGSVPGGNVFEVDPNFLSYTATPIKITAVVRRNAANDEAGFKLVYEAADGHGFKNIGWYSIPDNKEWHTVSWELHDAQFVNYWGYNFSLNSDGNRFNKYDIQSVTVTKLTP